MSLVQLIPIVNNLSQPEKLELFELLACQIPEADLQTIFSATEYPVFSPYDSTEAADILKQMIEEAEYDRALAISERLVANRNLSNEESQFLSLIVTLIEDYEGKHYPMGDVSPHAALLHLMEYSCTSQTDLIGSIGSQAVVSEIVDAKRSIDPIQAKALGEYFQVSASLFI